MSTLKSALDTSSNLEPISNSLRSIKLIRSNVKDLFKLLADGNQNAFDPFTDDENSQNKFVNDVQILMNNINKRLIELETSAVLAQSNISSSINLGNASSLGLDPNQERQQLYNSMIQSYRWYDKLTDAAIHANSILSLNHLKRTSWLVFNQRNRSLAPKKQLTTGFNVPSQNVEATINIINKPLGLKIEYDYSLGDSLLLKITLERVLKGVILLRGYIIEWVNVKGINEEFLDLDDNLDIWTESKYEVFRKVTDHMNTSMLHHSTPLHSEQALRSFLIWFKSYYNLFDKECKKCGNKLKNYLPPTWRDLRTCESYHFHCI